MPKIKGTFTSADTKEWSPAITSTMLQKRYRELMDQKVDKANGGWGKLTDTRNDDGSISYVFDYVAGKAA